MNTFEKHHYVIFGIVATFIFTLLIPVTSYTTYIKDKTWVTTISLIEEYESYECSYDSIEEETTCEWETNTRVLDKRSFSGNHKTPVIYPEPFILRNSDHRNRYHESYYVVYANGVTNLVNKQKWLMFYYIEQTCKIYMNVWGFVVLDRCIND